MTREELLLQAKYDRWPSGRRFGTAARISGKVWTRPVASRVPGVRDALVPLVNSAVIWLARWQEPTRATGLRAAAFPSAVKALQLRWRQVTTGLREFLAAIPEARLQVRLTYRTATGQKRSEVREGTILHLMPRAADHRGAVNSGIRLLGGMTVHTDYLHFRGLEAG